MSEVVIQVENVSKEYRLGTISHGTLSRDLQSKWAKFRGKEDPNMKIGFGNQEPGTDLNERFWALKDVSFDVHKGEILGIIGRNGAGKSTLLKILSRVTAPTTGSIKIKGRVASLLEVGTGFHPELTGRENIFLNGTILGMSKDEIETKFDDIVRFAEIDKFIDTPVKRYSSGMYVRLAFAVAAHLDPDILVLDEVLAVGDAQFQKKCLGKIKNISGGGKTILIVSHNMAMINNLCSRAIILVKGEILDEGEPSTMTSQYLEFQASSGGKIIWENSDDAPATENVRVHSVRILQDKGGKPTSEVDISKPCYIEISFWNLKEGNLLYTAIWLKDGMGTEILSSSNHAAVSSTIDEWVNKPRPIGFYRSLCELPGNFLNEKRYLVTPIVGILPSNTQVLLEDIISFDVIDTGEMRKEFYGEWLGVIRPKLGWSTEYIDN